MRVAVLSAATGVLVAALAVLVPGGPVHGSPATGPHGIHGYRTGALAHDLRVRWAARHDAIELGVRDGRACRPVLRSTGSLAPQHVEAVLSRPSGARCSAPPQRWWDLRLPLPAVAQAGTPVDVVVDDVHLRLRA